MNLPLFMPGMSGMGQTFPRFEFSTSAGWHCHENELEKGGMPTSRSSVGMEVEPGNGLAF